MSVLPLATISMGSENSKSPTQRSRVASETRTASGGEAASRRWATLIACPVTTSYSPRLPVVTRPVWMPVRKESSRPFGPPSTSRRIRERNSRAEVMARAASSSWSSGTPKTATRASPMYFSTMPPWARMISSKSPKILVMRESISSGSMRSERLVKPFMSAKRMVAVRRSPAFRLSLEVIGWRIHGGDRKGQEATGGGKEGIALSGRPPQIVSGIARGRACMPSRRESQRGASSRIDRSIACLCHAPPWRHSHICDASPAFTGFSSI